MAADARSTAPTWRWPARKRTAGRTYLEWTAIALGMQIDGVTVLVLDGQGPFARVAVYHRPLAALLAFSTEMARRLATGPGAGHFYQVP